MSVRVETTLILGCGLLLFQAAAASEPADGDDIHGGCSSIPPVYTLAECGDIFSATAWADAGTRDTDWYLLTHYGNGMGGNGPVSGTLCSEFPGVCFVVDGIPECMPVVVGVIGCSNGNETIQVASADLPMGEYVVFVATGDCSGAGIFDGFPCADGVIDYVVEIGCTPLLVATEQSLIIKQGACPAPVNPNGHGVIPMLLVGDTDFDVSTIDFSSLRLRPCGSGSAGITPINGPPGPPIQIADLNHPFDGGPISCADGPCACNENQDADGIDALWLRFSTDAFVAAFGTPSRTLVVELTGELNDGSAFFARDCMVLVPPGSGPISVSIGSNAANAFVDVQPPDLNLDTGGFGNFARTYLYETAITATADFAAADGRTFSHWLVDGTVQSAGRGRYMFTLLMAPHSKPFIQAAPSTILDMA